MVDYVFKNNQTALLNSLESAEVPPDSIKQLDEILLHYNNALDQGQEEALMQAMLDAEYDLVSGAASIGSQMETAASTSTTAISSVTPTSLLTLPAIRAEGRKVKVQAVIQLRNQDESARVGSFRLFRDDAEVDSVDRYDFSVQPGDATALFSAHWVDSNPGSSPVYEIRCLADGSNLQRFGNSRATAEA